MPSRKPVSASMTALCGVLACVGIAPSQDAQAASFGVKTTGSVGAYGEPNVEYMIEQTGEPEFVLARSNSSSSGGFYQASVESRITRGHVRVLASAQANGGVGVRGANEGSPATNGWWDTLTTTSTTLPLGAPVDFEVVLTLSYDLTTSGAGTHLHSGYVSAYAQCFGEHGEALALRLEQPGLQSPRPARTITGVVHSSVGRTFDLQGHLRHGVGATVIGGSSSLTTLSAGRGSSVSVRSLTPGATYTTASGARYEACPGDTDGDRIVDFIDLNNVLSDFGSVGFDLTGDLDLDGDCDFVDLNIVLGAFGVSC